MEDLITIEQFFQTKMKVGTILFAEPIKKADKLYKLGVNLGEETPRQIVSGLRQHYSVEDLVGKQVIVVTNLKPVTLRGVISAGMLLATANSEGKVSLILPEPGTPNGTEVG